MKTEPEGVEESTRDRVLRSILEHGPSTAGELAERLSLTPAAVRRHLGSLIESEQIESREQQVRGQRGRGRPAKVFCLTDTGRQDFPHAYDNLAIAALEQLVEAVGPDAIRGIAQARSAGVIQRYRDLSADDVTPADALAQALDEDGFVVSQQAAPAGEQLCQHHCPIATVAERFPELCEAETELFAELLGVHVQRLATIAHGDGVCTTHIPHTRKVEQ
ncbi:helix-turn-helix transcriptional regulator [Enemella sp. A6]|uniref:helix-turn-helix transcriptional regulator n=1 Tax=Enemella sp. A6 TaxID=3440152 RepID=UPI003EBA0B0A